MSNNFFYKALAAVSTVGIVVIAGIQVTTALKKGNTAEDQLAKTMIEIKNLRKEALAEVNLVKKEVLKELSSLSSDALEKVETVQKSALSEVKTIRSDLLKELDSVRLNSLNEIKVDRGNALGELSKAKTEALKDIKKVGGNNSDKVWLLLRFGTGAYAHLQKVPMTDMSQCEMQGAIYTGSKRLHPKDFRGYECLETE